MASELTIEIKHAVHETWSHQAGANLTVDPARLETLLSQGDAALDRGSGMFFEAIDDQLVIVFSENRSEKTKGQMRYFDVFTLSVESVDGAHIVDLITGLQEFRVPEYGVEPEPILTVTLPQEPVQNTSNHANGSSSPYQNEPVDAEMAPNEPPADNGGVRDSAQPNVDVQFVAEIWEQIRRDTVQCQATLDDAAKYFQSVDEAIRQTSFVSQCREDVNYFDIAGGKELEMKTNPEGMVELVTDLVAKGDLTYDALPTYREELEQKREQERANIRNDDQLSETAKQVIGEFYTDVDSVVEEYPKLAAKLMREVEDDTLPKKEEEEGGITSRFSGLMNGNDDQDATELIEPADYPHIDNEIIVTVDTELNEERERIKQDIENRLWNELRYELLTEFDRHAKRVADDAMSSIEDTRTSKLHEWAKDTETEY
jgi:hypothetical protein